MIRGGAFLAGNARRVSVQAALGLAMLALFMRVLIPAGWMPASAERGFSIILCTGQGAMSAWIDEKGELHEGKPGDDRASHPCVFAGFGAAFDLRPFDIAPSLFVVPVVLPFAFARGMGGVGHGLAAPPPPPTGPPGAL
ncbi:hypothetical protein [Rhizorhabdus sp. FW153]|uniref:hypothetical protein n=1 Tax=Rhizorhabdus sp. FW153 TaxID=3400216 RepID=UPI003CE7CE54